MTAVVSAVITGVSTFIATLGGSAIFFIQQDRRMKELLNENQKIVNESQRSEEWHKIAQEYEKEKEEIREEAKQWREAYESLRIKEEEGHRKGTEDKIDLIKQIGMLELENQRLCHWKCLVRGCANRIPPQEQDIIQKS